MYCILHQTCSSFAATWPLAPLEVFSLFSHYSYHPFIPFPFHTIHFVFISNRSVLTGIVTVFILCTSCSQKDQSHNPLNTKSARKPLDQHTILHILNILWTTENVQHSCGVAQSNTVHFVRKPMSVRFDK
jgi:hypothetical protein